jgi:hypothetical protein
VNQIDMVRAAVARLKGEFSLAELYAQLAGEPLTRRGIAACVAQMIDQRELARVGDHRRRDTLHRFRRGPNLDTAEALAAVEARRQAVQALDRVVRNWTIQREQGAV